MRIRGTEVDEGIVDQALKSMNTTEGFVASELITALEGLGVPEGEVAMRTADRAVQRARVAGTLVWKDRRWKAKGTSK